MATKSTESEKGRSESGTMVQGHISSSSLPSFLKVSVMDPVKMGTGVQAYVSYKVFTETNLPKYDNPEKMVIRRYNDFVWLRERLFEKYKGIFIPPLPEKNTVEKFRFSAEFIETRRQALDVFIKRVASHPELQQSEDLRIFLQASEQTMESARSIDTGIFVKPGGWMQIFKDVQSRVKYVLGRERPAEESNAEYDDLKLYIFHLENHLAEAQKHAFDLVRRHKELGQSLSDFGNAVKLLGKCEGDSVGKAFSVLGDTAENLSAKLERNAHDLLMNFEEPLKDYVRSVQSIKATIAERANAFRRQNELAETIKAKEIELMKLRLTQSVMLFEAERELKELKEEAAEATRVFERIVKRMEEEMVRFQEERTRELGLAFYNFAKGEAQLENDFAEGWRTLLPAVEACSV